MECDQEKEKTEKTEKLSGKEIRLKNLKPFKPVSELTPEEYQKQKEISLKGGQANKLKWEKKKNFNELAKSLIDCEITREKAVMLLGEDAPILDELETLTIGNVLNVRMIQEAMSGTVKAYEALRDTAGYAPKKEIELNADITTAADRSLLEKVSDRLKSG